LPAASVAPLAAKLPTPLADPLVNCRMQAR